MRARGCLAVLSGFIFAVFLDLTAWGAGAQQVTFPDRPAAENFYVDEAGLIARSEGRAINEVAGALLRDHQVPLVVVTISSLAAHNAPGYTIERYSFELFNRWGIGSERRNYGMLFLVSKGDRRARIELGAAWGHSYNIQAEEVMNTLVIPRFKEEKFSEGILAGVRGMDAVARGLALPRPAQPWWILPLVLGALGLAGAAVISLFKSGRKGWGWALIALLGLILFFLLRAAARSRGSGGAFGGGLSGGGGASGSW
jgi:uncharacterized protein